VLSRQVLIHVLIQVLILSAPQALRLLAAWISIALLIPKSNDKVGA
jgi:hypothetical protein